METFSHHNNAESIRRTSRDFSKYQTFFGYSEQAEELVGKEILDIGAGDSDFAETVNEHLPAALVWRVDPDYEKRPPKYTELCAVGIVQDLPFSDNQFDEVISSWAVSEITIGTKDALREMVRVVKPDGKIKLYPVVLNSRDRAISLPEGVSFLYDEDKAKVYSNKTLQIVKPEYRTDTEWEAIFQELVEKLYITEEEFQPS